MREFLGLLQIGSWKLDGRTYDTSFAHTPGGVARNICESLYKLGFNPNLISIVGRDKQGEMIKKSIPETCSDLVETHARESTAQCVIVFDNKGDSKFSMMDVGIHESLRPEIITENVDLLKNAPLIVIDANTSMAALNKVLEIATIHQIPVFFEPTDISICTKPFKTKNWRCIKFITPNVRELHLIASTLQISTKNLPPTLENAATVSKKLLKHIDNVIVTLGPKGILIARKGFANESFCVVNGEECVRFYPTKEVKSFVNVSGAGDCFASGLIAAMLDERSEEICVSVGFAAAQLALQCQSAVPKMLFDRTHECWKTPAFFEKIL